MMKREIEFFNVHIEFGSCIIGMIIALEEQKPRVLRFQVSLLRV